MNLPANRIPPSPICVRPGTCLRLARPTDSAAILRLFDSTPMAGKLVVSTDRSPDFFTLYNIQNATTECWVTERDTEIVGCATFVIRSAWIHGKPGTVAYLGDLRYSLRGFGVLTKFYASVLDEVKRRHRVDVFYTGIMASNLAARKALVERKGKRQKQPAYHPLRSYDAVNLRFSPWLPKVPATWQVRRANLDDLPSIVDRLHEDHKQRPLGYRFDLGEFQHRLNHWPDFRIEHTYLAYQHGQLKGLCTLWDAGKVKRYRVHAYREGMKWLYRSSKLASRVLNMPALPDPGHSFRYAYLANFSAYQNDPQVLQALLSSIMRDARSDGYHFLMAYIEDQSPLHHGLKRFSCQKTPFDLYEVTSPNAGPSSLSSNRTGFEIALA